MDNIYENNRNPEIEKRFAECDGIYLDYDIADGCKESESRWSYKKNLDGYMWINEVSHDAIVIKNGHGEYLSCRFSDYGKYWSFDKPDWWDDAEKDGTFFKNKPGG